MARTLQRIQEDIYFSILQTPLSYLLTSTSKTAKWRNWVFIFAYAIWLHEQIVSKNAENSRPHTIRWYREQCLNFLDGLPLVWKDGQFKYDLTNVTDAPERKIIDRCAVLESNNGELVIKIATSTGGALSPITADQLLRFKAYVQQIKDGGNRMRFVNTTGDVLKIDLTVYVNPLMIDLATGRQLNAVGDVFPVKDAINRYLENLEFNGAFYKTFLIDAVQKAEGVKLPIVNILQSKFSVFDFVNIVEWKVPESGYFTIADADLTINYLAYVGSN
jgi:hypothetical protein